MAEQVILEIVPQVVGEEAIENEIKGVGEAAQQAFKKANTENAKYIETMQRIEKTVRELGSAQGKTENEIKKTLERFQKLSQVISKGAMEQVAIEAEQATAEFKEFGAKVFEVEGKTKSLKTELRILKTELAAMEEAGQDGSQQFQEMALRAAELEDQIGDTAARIRAMASDTFALDGTIEVLGGVAAAYSAAQGIQGLFGEQSEDFQKTLLKVQSATALVTALQQFQNLVQKQSTAQLLINNGIEKLGAGIKNAYAVATGRITVAQSLQAAATARAAATQTLLNNAMKVSPIMLIVSALAMAVALWSKYSDAAKEASEIEAELWSIREKGIAETQANLEKFHASLNDIRTTQVRIAEIEKRNEMEIFDLRKKQLEEEQKGVKIRLKSLGLESEIKQRLNNAYETYYSAITNGNKSEANAAQARIDYLEKQLSMIDELKNKQKELAHEELILEAEKQAKIKERKNREQLAAANNAVLIAAEGSKKELNARVVMYRVEYNQAVQNASLTNSEKYKLYLEYLHKVREAEKNFFKVDVLEKQKQSLDDIFNIAGLGNEQKATIALTVGFSKEDIRKKLEELNALVLEGTGDMRRVPEVPVNIKPKFDDEAFKQVANAMITAVGMVSDEMFAQQSEARAAQLSATLEKIDEEKQHEIDKLKEANELGLINSEQLKEREAAINEKYRKKEAEAKLQAWKADQQAKGEQALINGLLSFTMSLAQQGYPAGLITGGIAMGLAAVQAALIFSKAPPAFATGTKGSKVTPAGFKLVGEEGPELIYDNGGKKVITAPDTAKILAAYNIPALPNLEGALSMKDAAVGYAVPAIDYDLLGQAISDNIAKHPKVVMNVDKNGLQIHTMQHNVKRQILNSKYTA